MTQTLHTQYRLSFVSIKAFARSHQSFIVKASLSKIFNNYMKILLIFFLYEKCNFNEISSYFSQITHLMHRNFDFKYRLNYIFLMVFYSFFENDYYSNSHWKLFNTQKLKKTYKEQNLKKIRQVDKMCKTFKNRNIKSSI